jgi:hypothetical protein
VTEAEEQDLTATIKNAIDQSKGQRANWLATILTSIGMIIFAITAWVLYNEVQELREENSCRSQIAAEDRAAGFNVLLVFARGSANASSPSFSVEEYRNQVGIAADRLDRAQTAQDNIDKVCDE